MFKKRNQKITSTRGGMRHSMRGHTARSGALAAAIRIDLLLGTAALASLSMFSASAMAATTLTTTDTTVTPVTTVSSAASDLADAIAAYAADPSDKNKTALDTALAAYTAAVSTDKSQSLDDDTIKDRTYVGDDYATVVDVTGSATISGVTNDGSSADDQALVGTGDEYQVRGSVLYVEEGGAAYIGSDSGDTLTISGNAVEADSGYDAQGGAIYSAGGTLVVDSTDFTSNVADSDSGDAYGGAITTTGGTTIVSNSTFTGNYATAGDNGSGDKSYARGGAINISGGTLYIYDSDFTSNYASGDDYSSSGAINSGGTVTIVDSTFTGNYASGGTIEAYAGAILNKGTMTITGSTFTGNYATTDDDGADSYGGAIYNNSSSSVLNLTDTSFSENYVEAESGTALGGAIYNNGGTVNLTDASFSQNYVEAESGTALGGAIYNNGGTINLDVSAGGTSTFSGNSANGSASSIYMAGGTLNVDTDTGGVLDMLDPMSGTSATITKSGSGTWKLGGDNSFSGTSSFTVSEGTLYLYDGGEVENDVNASVSTDDATVVDGSITLTGSTSSIFELGGDATLVAGGTNTISSSGTIVIDDGATIRGGTADDRSDNASGISSSLTLTASGNTELEGALTVEAVDASDTFTLIANLVDATVGSDSYTGSLIKTGEGTVVLEGDNDYSGSTTVEAGTLQAGSKTAFSQDTAYVVDGGTLDLNVYDLTMSSLSGTGGTVSLGTATLTVDQDSTTSYAGSITGSGSLVKDGSGTLTLTGSNSYDGDTSVDGGTLEITSGGSISDDNGYIATSSSDSASVVVDGDGSSWVNAGDLYVGYAGDGELTISDGGYVSDVNGYVDAVASSSGTVTVTGSGSEWENTGALYVGYDGTGELDVADDAEVSADTIYVGYGSDTVGTLTVSEDATVTVDDGSGTIYVAYSDGSTGTVVIGAAAGEDAVAAGTLEASALAFGEGDGTLVFNHTDDDYEFSVSLSGSGSVDAYSGTTVLTADNSDFDGVFDLYGGVVSVSSASNLGSASLVFDGGTLATTADMTLSNAITLDDDGGTIDTASDTTLTLSSDIDGEGGLTKDGDGALVLTGDSSYTGDTEIAAGSLEVDGSLASSVIVDDGTTLYGTGTVGGITVNDGGVVSVGGDDVGTMSVTGDVTFGSGSTYVTQVSADGISDLLDVDGTVTLSDGSALAVSAADVESEYALDTVYTLITAAGGVSGTFTDTSDDFAYLQYEVTYDADDVYLTITRATSSDDDGGDGDDDDTSTSGDGDGGDDGSDGDVIRFADLVDSPNGKSAANAIEGMDQDSSLYKAVLYLLDGEPNSALKQLSGGVHAGVAAALMERSQLSRNVVLARLRRACGNDAAHADQDQTPKCDDTRLQAWGSAFGSWSRYGGDGNGSGLDVNGGGALFGVDKAIDGGWQVGATLGYARDVVSEDDTGSRSRINGYYIGGYGATTFGHASLRVGGLYGVDSIRGSRSVQMSTYSDDLSSNYDAQMIQAFAEGAWDMRVRGFNLEPYANLAYVHMTTDSFTEDGGIAALSVGGGHYDDVYSTLGVRGDRLFDLGSVPAKGTVDLGWRHLYGDQTLDSVMAFSGSSDFSVSSTAMARDAAIADMALDLAISCRSSLRFSYLATVGENLRSQAVVAKYGVKF